jgi:hypothetical protein
MMRILRAGVLYFALVFAAGFVFGTVRVLWVVPRVGTMAAELIETPFMLVVVILAARWTIRRMRVPAVLSIRLGVGLLALALLSSVELTFVLWLRGLSISEYVASRDPVSGTVYAVMLGVFAIMPLLVARKIGREAPFPR